jgi:hypothetical protein
MLDPFMISIIRQGVALYKRGYSSAVGAVKWAVVGQTAFANGGEPFEDVTQEQYTAQLDLLANEFTGTDIVAQIATL